MFSTVGQGCLMYFLEPPDHECLHDVAIVLCMQARQLLLHRVILQLSASQGSDRLTAVQLVVCS
jgi:hypothetical protein